MALVSAGRPVTALVRAANAAVARRRLLARLRRSAGWRPELAALVEAAPGDSTRERFGLAADAVRRFHAVVHCAANTQFAAREDRSVWETNVGGARQLAAVADEAAPGARIVFVGTASVVTAPAGACLDEDAPFAGHANTYTRSKRAAEEVLAGRGVVVARPSIVLARGVRDRAMVRSILWAVPVMGELGDVPVDAAARVDLVPVDHVARALAMLAMKPSLRHAVYHLSAGDGSHAFGALWEAMARANPSLPAVRMSGRGGRAGAARRLLRPLGAYLPFVNADARYSNARLRSEIGAAGEPPPALSYVPALVGQVTRREALAEMARP